MMRRQPQPGDLADNDHERQPDAIDRLLAFESTFAERAELTAQALAAIPYDDHFNYLPEIYRASSAFVFIFPGRRGNDAFFGAKNNGTDRIVCMRVASFAEAESLANMLAGRAPDVVHK